MTVEPEVGKKRAATKATDDNSSKKIKQQDNKINKQDAFLETFDKIVLEIVSELKKNQLPENGIDWVERMAKETILGGKMNRGLTVLSALESILKRELNLDELRDGHVLGWLIEMAMFLIQDDIMDASITRRGNPCWFRRKDVGMIAINDAMLIEMIIYKLLKRYFKTHDQYVEFIELFHETTYQTELGQLMDLITAPESNVDLSRFSIEKHAYIVEYKTAYYSFFLPIALAMRYAGITDNAAYDQAKAVLLPLGEYFQVQDDYLDCYGSPEVIGKIGTDIEDNKCGWLIVQALSLANDVQRKILDDNYGRKSPKNVELVKQVFKELDMEGHYQKYEENSYVRLTAIIEKVDETLLPRKMFTDFMDRIYKRTA